MWTVTHLLFLVKVEAYGSNEIGNRVSSPRSPAEQKHGDRQDGSDVRTQWLHESIRVIWYSYLDAEKVNLGR